MARQSNWYWYGVKIINKILVSGEPQNVDENYSNETSFFEESISLFKAQSFEQAYKLAEANALKNETSYINTYSQTVEWKFVAAIDCFLLDDQPVSKAEVYSSIHLMPKGMTSEAFIAKQFDNENPPDKEEKMYILRNKEEAEPEPESND
ncbi:MAG: DUF4288 domain-containing protein [Oscillospiraceae bacterium]